MTINFHDSSNRSTYASRTAEANWIQIIQEYVDIEGKNIVDLGCGGGIYSKVFAQSGAQQIIAMDFSIEMVKGAEENCKGLNNITFLQGNALETNLEAGMTDLLLERALIHHISDLESCYKEANRILKTKGTFIIQDRTPEDCSLSGSSTHIRGYFFEKFPRLLERETKRRYSSAQVVSTLHQAGFNLIKEIQLWETRKVYHEFNQLRSDLMNRTGRSILHELSDTELGDLVEYIEQKVDTNQQIREKDRWTVWIAEKA